LAEPYLLIDQDISTYENNPEYKQYKASIRREVRPADQAVTLPETISEVEAGVKELKQRAARPTTKPVITKEPPVSMVGKEVIPGVTPTPITPAPVTEQAAPAEAPAPEVAGFDRTDIDFPSFDSLNEYQKNAYRNGTPSTSGATRGFIETPDNYFVDPAQLPVGAVVDEDFQGYAYPKGDGKVGYIFMDLDGVARSGIAPDELVAKVKSLSAAQPAVSETITEPAIKFANEALRERDKEVSRYRKKADSERNAGREEMAQRYEGMIDDLMSVPSEDFKKDVIENPEYYIESNIDPFLRFKNKEVNRATPLTPSKRKKEAGGVLIPTKEDFIQAGQNIYEAGMEFGAWAKQMIQRFGDAVREFLGEV
jgi:hypothetical protein